ncbi:hypothetical protein QUA41_26170 [Microcoleus sp. Pol11C1]
MTASDFQNQCYLPEGPDEGGRVIPRLAQLLRVYEQEFLRLSRLHPTFCPSTELSLGFCLRQDTCTLPIYQRQEGNHNRTT